MNFIGIDPGKNGGLAMIDSDGAVVDVVPMPDTPYDILDLLREWERETEYVSAMLEQVASSPQMGVKSSFTFGQGFGWLEMALHAAGIPFHRVAPSRWQRAIGCLTKGDKNVTKRKAQELFPSVKVTHAIADALLIAEYGRRVR